MSHHPFPRLMLAEAVPSRKEPLYEFALAARHTRVKNERCGRRIEDARPHEYMTDLFDTIFQAELHTPRGH